MRKFQQNKLWRDKLPAQHRAMGSRVHVLSLNDHQFDVVLREKLIEEANEVQSAVTASELVEELADLFEVAHALMNLHNITKDQVSEAGSQKKESKGGFFARQYVTYAEHALGSMGESYCLNDPDKYPEIF